VSDTLVPAVIEVVDVALRSYFLAPPNEPMLTNPDEVWEAIRDLKVRQGTWPKRYTELSLKASFPASGLPPGLQRNSPHQSLPFLVEARSSDLYP
jgi:hypothetical protein